MRLLFPLLIAVLFLEGLARKLMPQLGAEVLLVKDCLIALLTAYLFTFKRHMLAGLKSGMNGTLVGLFVLVIALSLVSLISLQIPVPIYLLGFREYFFYTAVVVTSYAYFDLKRAKRFFAWLFCFAAVVDVLGILQATGTINSWLLLPIEKSFQAHSSAHGEFALIASIFDVPERFAAFNLFIFISCWNRDDKDGSIYHGSYRNILLVVSLASLFVSGRRIAFLLAMCYGLGALAFENRTTRGRIRALCGVVFAATGGIVFLNSYDTVLSRVIFSRDIIEESIFYIKLAYVWYSDALQATAFSVGAFGFNSPGVNAVMPENIDILPGVVYVEGLWDKTIVSLGILGAGVLFVSVLLLIRDLRRNAIRCSHPLPFYVYAYVLCIMVWNLKSGEFLVWSPFTCLLIGMSYRLSRHSAALSRPLAVESGEKAGI